MAPTEIERLACGCKPDFHKGPGCPVWRGGPPKFMVNCISMVTMMHNGVLHMRVRNSWMPMTTQKHYDDLNEFLRLYRLDYEGQRAQR